MSQHQHHLNRLLEDGNVELRCIDKVSGIARKRGRAVVWSGIYNGYDDIRRRIIWAEKQGFDIYSTINPVSLSATNADLKPYKQTIKDSNIEKITTLFFDFDAVRDTGTAATPDQVDHALSQSHKVVDWLEGYGFSMPTIGLSGNGAHLLYRTDMTIDEAECFAGLYAGLKKRFSTDEVEFDVVVRNPARIARVLGTINRKADRRSSCVFSDAITSAEVITGLAEQITPPKPKRTWVQPDSAEKAGRFIKNWDIVGAFVRAGLYLKQTRYAGKHWVSCINAANHGETGPTDTIIFDGQWPQYSCSHSHCSHLGITDVISFMRG